MGTVFRIVCYADADSLAQTAARKAFEQIDRLNAQLSDYLPESELNRLCDRSGTGEEIAVSQELFEVLELAQTVSAVSEGAFDVSVGPIVRVWRRARRKHRLPDPDSIRIARQAVGYEAIVLNPATCGVQLLRPDMRLDLGGIAKGYAADQVLDLLRRQGITAALVDAGGDIVVGAPPPDKQGWEISMESLGEQGERTLRVLEIAYSAVATSGDTYRYLEVGGKRYSHILDPRSGRALTSQCKVTVVAPTGALADAWASALSVMDSAAAFELATACAWLELQRLCAEAQQEFHLQATPGLTP